MGIICQNLISIDSNFLTDTSIDRTENTVLRFQTMIDLTLDKDLHSSQKWLFVHQNRRAKDLLSRLSVKL